jgi:hypothetical protein
MNKTNVIFSNDELTVLEKGLKYNLHYKHKSWINPIDLEAETAKTQLPTYEQDYIRQQVAHNTTSV